MPPGIVPVAFTVALPTWHAVRGIVFAFPVASAIGGRKRAADDARYDGVDWIDAQNKLLLYVAKRVGRRPLDVENIAGTALLKALEPEALEPEARPWDRTRQTFLEYLGSYANTEIWNLTDLITRPLVLVGQSIARGESIGLGLALRCRSRPTAYATHRDQRRRRDPSVALPRMRCEGCWGSC
jgi:hypothetical protein